MKNLFTLLLFVYFSNNAFTQVDFSDIPNDVLKYFPHYSDLNPTNNSNHATLRAPFALDSVHSYIIASQDILVDRRIHNHDNVGRDLGFINYDFDIANNVWDNDRREEIVYHTNGGWELITRDEWNETTSMWQENSRFNYTYDANENLLFFTWELWDDQSQSLQNYWKYEYSYNNDNQRIEYNSYSWDLNSSQWNPRSQGFYFYNALELLETFDLKRWDTTTSTFEDNAQILYEYNSEQLLETYTLQNWDPVTYSYVNNNRRRYTYDSFGNQIDFYFDTWDITSMGWDESSVTVGSYDANNNLAEEIYYLLDITTNTWVAIDRDEYFYTDLNLVNVNLPENISLNCKFQNPISVSQIIECVDENENKIYHYSIIDISGRILIKNSFEKNVSIKIPRNVKAGIYFLNIWRDDTMMIREKIIVTN